MNKNNKRVPDSGREPMKVNIAKMFMGLLSAFAMFQYYGFYSQAGIEKIGENFKNWAVDQLFWVAIVIVVIICLSLLIKKAYVQMGIFMVVGGFVCFLIAKPDVFKTFGESLYNILIKGT